MLRAGGDPDIYISVIPRVSFLPKSEVNKVFQDAVNQPHLPCVVYKPTLQQHAKGYVYKLHAMGCVCVCVYVGGC